MRVFFSTYGVPIYMNQFMHWRSIYGMARSNVSDMIFEDNLYSLYGSRRIRTKDLRAVQSSTRRLECSRPYFSTSQSQVHYFTELKEDLFFEATSFCYSYICIYTSYSARFLAFYTCAILNHVPLHSALVGVTSMHPLFEQCVL